MKQCEKCKSIKIEESTRNFSDDSHNIIKTSICQDCGHQKIEHINILEN